MCDYSLEAYKSRPATVGEQYTLTQFPSGSKGFAAAVGSTTAVCMMADARLELEGLSAELQKAHNVGASEEVTMTRGEAGPYRDGIRFRNGREILLQALDVGVKARLLDGLAKAMPANIGRELVDA